MSNKNVEPERVRKGPMTVEEIKAMRAAEGMIVDLVFSEEVDDVQ